jgi:hypothetical protein
MKPTPIISEKKAAIVIWIGAAVFTIGEPWTPQDDDERLKA